jgi:hypothetical protein
MRTSGLQAANNAFNSTLADKQLDLYDNYYNRQANNLANLLNTSNTLYNYMTGVNSGAQTQANNVNNYALNKTQMDNAAAASQGNMLGGAINGAMSGAAAGSAAGPWGALAGGIIGGAGGALANR